MNKWMRKGRSLGALGALRWRRNYSLMLGWEGWDRLKLKEKTGLSGQPLLGIRWKVRDDGRIWKHAESLAEVHMPMASTNKNPHNWSSWPSFKVKSKSPTVNSFIWERNSEWSNQICETSGTERLRQLGLSKRHENTDVLSRSMIKVLPDSTHEEENPLNSIKKIFDF